MLSLDIISSAVYLFSKNEDGEWCVLCGKRSGNDPRHAGGLFGVPCGMRDFGESPGDTAIREVEEETGIKLAIGDIRFIERQPWGNGNVGANFYGVLGNCVEPSGGDWENEFFTWLPVSKVGDISWAYGMGEKVLEIFEKHVKRLMTINEKQLRKIIREALEQWTQSNTINNGGYEPMDISKMIKNTNDGFTMLDEPMEAYKVVRSIEHAKNIRRNGFQTIANGLIYGPGFYFCNDKRRAVTNGDAYGNVLMTVEICPGARCKTIESRKFGAYIIVHPEDAKFIKIVDIQEFA